MSKRSNRRRHSVLLPLAACLTGIGSGAVVAWGFYVALAVTP